MRRLLVVFALALPCLLLVPGRAEANFWHWLDDLSGPKFKGWNVQWRAYCFTERVRDERVASYESLLQELRSDAARAEAEKRVVFDRAILAYGKARSRAVSAAEEGGLSKDVADKFVEASEAWRNLAVLLADSASDPQVPRLTVEEEQEATRMETEALKQDQVALDAQKQLRTFISPLPVAVLVSACQPTSTDRKRIGTIDINIAWGTDVKEENASNKNTIVMLGPSFSFPAVKSLDMGVGGGVAWFSSATNPSFARLYLEPVRVDWHPATIWKNPAKNCGWHNVWWQTAAVRYQMLLFPQGFPENSFGASPRYPAEVIHQWNLVFDLEPVMRRPKSTGPRPPGTC